MVRVALDAMGGDYAPFEIVRGAVEASKSYGVEILLVGPQDILHQELSKYNLKGTSIQVIHATETIEMSESPMVALRKKKDASIVVANNLVAEGRADAVVGAGSTGAAMASSLFRLGRIEGIDRPAIAAVLPTAKGWVVLLDAGANAECKPQHLLQFGLMGSIYAQAVLRLDNPRVGLINIGEEEEKGTEFTAQTYGLLRKSGLNFIGNIEGRDIPKGNVEVAVCDGFLGNVILKFAEGVGTVVFSLMREELPKGILGKLGTLLLKGNLKRLKKRMDYGEYGGGLLLGVKGVSVIAHGSSNYVAIKSAIRLAKESVEGEILSNIEKGWKEISQQLD